MRRWHELSSRSRWLLALAVLAVLAQAVGRRAQLPLDTERLLQRAEAQLQTGDAGAALRTFAVVAHRAPADARGFDGVARALQARPGFPRGDAAAESLLAAQESVLVRARHERWPVAGRATALRNHGVACFRLGEFARALPVLQELHASGAADLETDLALAVTSRACQRPDVARAAARAARARYGALESVWKLGLALQLDGDPWTTAAFVGLRNWTPWRAVDPVPSGCRTHLEAEDALDAGRLDAAEMYWRSLLGGPAAALARLGLGRAALRRDDAAAALVHFDAALADTAVPRETVHYWRARAFEAQGNDGAARTSLQLAAAANPLALRDDMLRAALETAARDTAAAVAAYQRVLDVDRRHPEALYQLGTLWLGTSHGGDGRTLLQRYLEVQPNGTHASDARRQLQGG